MKDNTPTVLVLTLLLLAVSVSSLEGLYTFKMIVNGLAVVGLIAIGIVSTYNYKKGRSR